VHSSTLAECTNIVDSSDRALLKFDILITQTLRMFIDFFSLLANFKISVARCNVRAALSNTAQLREFTASFITNI
jgi:hypothetical protein